MLRIFIAHRARDVCDACMFSHHCCWKYPAQFQWAAYRDASLVTYHRTVQPSIRGRPTFSSAHPSTALRMTCNGARGRTPRTRYLRVTTYPDKTWGDITCDDSSLAVTILLLCFVGFSPVWHRCCLTRVRSFAAPEPWCAASRQRLP